MVLVCAVPASAQAPSAWGQLPLPGGALAAREEFQLGDPDGRLDSAVLLDFVRRYANTDLRTAGERFEKHLIAVQAAPATPALTSTLPLPLPEFWQAEFGSTDVPLLSRILRSRTALLTYHGLMGLDAATLAQLSLRPVVLRGLLADDGSSAALAAFGQSLRIGSDGVVTPGGEGDRAVWQHLVGVSPADVDGFVAALLQRDAGRLAWFYDTVSSLPDAKRQFVLAADRPADERPAAALAVYQHFAAVDSNSWRISTRPFYRPTFDGAAALLTLNVSEGRVGPDWWPALFDEIAVQTHWSASGAAAAPDRAADARWFFDWLFAEPAEARQRFVAVRFAQRLFASTSREHAAHVRAALGGVLEMPLLMLSLERMGVRDPETLGAMAIAARTATHAGGAGRVIPALARWQAAIGLLEQIQRRAEIPEAGLTALVRSLATAAPTDPDATDGAVAAWLHDHLLPALVPADTASALLEEIFLRAATTPRATRAPSFTWEGLAYAIDGPAVALKSATTIRRSRATPQLQDVVELLRVRRAIVDTPSTAPAAATRQLVVRLERLAPVIALLDHRDDRRVRDFARLVQTIGGTTGPRIQQHLPVVTAALDALTEGVVPSLLYALAVSPTSEPVLYPEAWTRHGLEPPGLQPVSTSRPWREMAWQLPTDYGFGGGTRLIGAYLAVDVALADSQLARIQSDALPVPGVIDDPTRRGLVEPLVLAGLRAPHGVSPSHVANLATGRKLIETWATAPPELGTLLRTLREASVDAWRANLIAWDMAGARPAALQTLTISELAWLGATTAGRPEEDEPVRSGSSRLVDGCLCLATAVRITHEQLRGRRFGVQALRPHDLPLRLAELVTSIHLDVALVPALLPMALQDWLDRSRPAWSDDWEAFTPWPRRLTVDRVEQYLLHLVSTGVFSPPAIEESTR